MSGPLGAEGHWPRLDKLVLQDHRDHVRGGSELAPHLRAVPHATRVVARDPLTSALIEQGKPGDVKGGEPAQGDLGLGSVLWPTESDDKRRIPAWFLCAPAVTTEASRDLRQPTPSEHDGESTRERPAADPDAAAQRVKVRPIGGADHSPDDRFRALDAAMGPSLAPVPKGWPGVVLSATLEGRQVELFLPAGGGALVAVNWAGDPATSSVVFDEDDKGQIDPHRSARLPTLVRVARLGVDVGALAWQLTRSGKDGREGHGLTVDQATANPTLPGDPPPGAQPAPAPSPSAAPDFSPGDTVVRSAPTAPVPAPGVGAGTEVRSDSGAGDNRTVSLEHADEALVYAYASARRGGPFNCGHHEDKHRVGVTIDGEPINPQHVDVGAFYYQDQVRDGPLPFEGTPYSSPQAAPYSVRAHLRWDAANSYAWKDGDGIGGSVPGLALGTWRLEAESFLRSIPLGDPPPKPPPPQPPQPPRGRGDPGPDPPPGVDPGRDPPPGWYPPPFGDDGIADPDPPPLIVTNPQEFRHWPSTAGAVRFNPTSDPVVPPPEDHIRLGGSGTLEPVPEGGTGAKVPLSGMGPASQPGAIAATSQHLQFGGGTSHTATPIGRGVWDFSSALGTAFGGLSPTQKRCLDGAPVVARSFAYGKNPAAQWCHWQYATKPGAGRQGTATGGVVEHGPEVTPAQIMSGTIPTNTPAMTRVLPPGVAALAFGTPDQKTGEVKTGVVVDGDGRSMVVEGRDSTGAAKATVELDGQDGLVRMDDMDGAAATPGRPGYAVDGDAFYGIKADGTKVALDGGGGGGGGGAGYWGGYPNGDNVWWGNLRAISLTGITPIGGSFTFQLARSSTGSFNGRYSTEVRATSLNMTGSVPVVLDKRSWSSPHLPTSFNDVGSAGFRVRCCVPSGQASQTVVLKFGVYDPTTNNTQHASAHVSRTVTFNGSAISSDPSYLDLTIPQSSLTGVFAAGDQIMLYLELTHTVYGGGGGSFTTFISGFDLDLTG